MQYLIDVFFPFNSEVFDYFMPSCRFSVELLQEQNISLLHLMISDILINSKSETSAKLQKISV